MKLYQLTAFKVHSPGHADYCYKVPSQLLDGSACLQIKLPALARVEAGHGQGHRNEQGHGHGQALSRWRGLRR